MHFLQTQLKQCDIQCLRLLACGTVSMGELFPTACLKKQHHIPSDLRLQRHHCDPIKSRSVLVSFFSHLMTVPNADVINLLAPELFFLF